MIKYILYISGAALGRLLPSRIRILAAVLIADLVYALQRSRRAIVAENIRTVMSGALPDNEIRRLPRSIYRNFGILISDFLFQPFESMNARKKRVEFKGLEKLDHALAPGGGAIIVSAHMGNWELAGAALADRGYPVASVALDHPSGLVTRFFDARRRRAGIEMIKTDEFREKALSILEKGYILALMADRNISGKGREIILFGKKAVLPIGPFMLARQAGTSVFPAFMSRKGENRYIVEIEEPFPCDEDVERTHDLWAASLEAALTAHPADWMMFDGMFE